MTERDGGNYDVQRGFGEKARSLIAKGLVAVTLLTTAPGVRAEETPAPANPNVTPSVEADENKTKDGFPTTVEGYTPAPGNPLEGGNKEGYLTSDYKERQDGIAECKQEMFENGCLPQFLDFYSELLYSRRIDPGFVDSMYDWPERTILGNYISDEDIFESGRTGKPVGKLQLVYFKDENNNITNEPALACVFDSDYNIGLETFQEAVYRLEEDCPGFLRSLRKNNVVAFLQTNAHNGKDGGARFGKGVIYVGYSKLDKKDDTKEEIIKQLMTYLPVEGFGCRAFVLVGDDCQYAAASGEIKEYLDTKWNKYMYKKTKDKYYKTKAKEAEGWYKNYVKQSIYTKEELADILKKVESESLVYPYGVDSWDEINKVIGK